MASEKEARLFLGRDLWDELGQSQLLVRVEGKPAAMLIRNFWPSCMHAKVMIRSPDGTRKWLPELAGPGRSPALVDFLEFCKDRSAVFEIVKSSDLSPTVYRLISTQQSRLQEAPQGARELVEEEQAATERKKAAKERKKAARKARKKAKAQGENTPPEASELGAGDPEAGSGSDSVGSQEEEAKENKGKTLPEASEKGAGDKVASSGSHSVASQDEEAEKKNENTANTPAEASREENSNDADDSDEALHLPLPHETVVLDGLPSFHTALESLLSLKQDVESMQKNITQAVENLLKNIKELHLDVSQVSEAGGRAIVKSFAEEKYGMQTSVPLPHSLSYPVDDEVEALAELCPRPAEENPRQVPQKADIDCFLPFKDDGTFLIAEITRADLLVNGKNYVHPENLKSPTPSSKILYKLVQLERGVLAVEASSGDGSVKAAVLASSAFRKVSPESGIVLLQTVMNKYGGKFKKLERLAASGDLHTLSL